MLCRLLVSGWLIAGAARATETLSQVRCGMGQVDQIEMDVWAGGLDTGHRLVAEFTSYVHVYSGGGSVGRQMHCSWSHIMIRKDPLTDALDFSGFKTDASRCTPCEQDQFTMILTRGNRPCDATLTVTGRRTAGIVAPMKAWGTVYRDSMWSVGGVTFQRYSPAGSMSQSREITFQQRASRLELSGCIPAAHAPRRQPVVPFDPLNASVQAMDAGCHDSITPPLVIRQYPFEVLRSGTPTGEIIVADIRLGGTDWRESAISAVIVYTDEERRSTFLGVLKPSDLVPVSRSAHSFVFRLKGLEFTGQTRNEPARPDLAWDIHADGVMEATTWQIEPGPAGKEQRYGHGAREAIRLRPLTSEYVIRWPEISRYLRLFSGTRLQDFD